MMADTVLKQAVRGSSKISGDRKFLLAMTVAALFSEAMMVTMLYENQPPPSLNDMLQRLTSCQQTLNRIYTKYSNEHPAKSI